MRLRIPKGWRWVLPVLLALISACIIVYFYPSKEGFDTNSCAELVKQQRAIQNVIAAMRQGIVDISGGLGDAQAIKRENIGFQKSYVELCSKDLTEPCKQLARSDEYLFPGLLPIDAANASVIYNESDLQAELKKLQNYAKSLNCPAVPLSTYSADKDVGYANVALFRKRLLELSPYYISPVILANLSDILLGKEFEKSVTETNGMFKTAERNVGSARSLVIPATTGP